jgi:phospholipid transport system substrate-binding protein
VSALLLATVVATLALGFPARAGAATPTEELRGYTDRVLRVLRDSTLTPPARRAAVRDLAEEAFDVPETARRALGVHWERRTPAEREDFVRLFRDFLERTFVPWVDWYGGESIRYVSERRDGDSATVGAMIVTRLGVEVTVESRLLRKGDRWRVYDVLVEHLSLVAYYRSQFDRIIRTASYDELVQRLRTQVRLLADDAARLPGRR